VSHSGQCVPVTVPNAWHEEMRGRALAFLVTVDDRLPHDTAALAHDMIDANEYGIAVEIMRDILREQQASLTVAERGDLDGMLTDMGLDL
jgi:hypothetical protein